MSVMKFTIILLSIGFIVIAALAVWLFQLDVAPYINRPEQQEQVEVIGKRERINRGTEYSDTIHYYITFKFSDGSVKELEIGFGARYSSKRRAGYDSINEGDTGILIYKEIENIQDKIEDEAMYSTGRRFISFEKDSGYGRVKVEMSPRRQSENTVAKICIGFLVSYLIFSIVVLTMTYKRQIIDNSVPEQYAQVSVIDKMTPRNELRDPYLTFKFPDGLTTEFAVKKSVYDSINEHDTGTLSYKEYKQKIYFISFEKDVVPTLDGQLKPD